VSSGVTALEKATSLSREPVGLGYLGCAYAPAGRQEDARAILDELLTRKAERFVLIEVSTHRFAVDARDVSNTLMGSAWEELVDQTGVVPIQASRRRSRSA
jgi:hypothetical protein